MSKSEWKELPNWQDLGDYAFLDSTSLNVWAWELLRRSDEYRHDWQYFAKIVKKAKTESGDQWQQSESLKHYDPPKFFDETEYHWRRRVAWEMNIIPIKSTVHDFFSKKWGLKRMENYKQPCPDNLFYEEDCSYPKLIQNADSFYLLTEERGQNGEEAQVLAVKPHLALIAIDMTAHPGAQIEKLKELIDSHYKEMRKYEHIKRDNVPRHITDHLYRHLQVLDAIRADPGISGADIARALGYNEDSGSKTASQQGFRWIEQAITARDNYRRFLMTASVPAHNQTSGV